MRHPRRQIDRPAGTKAKFTGLVRFSSSSRALLVTVCGKSGEELEAAVHLSFYEHCRHIERKIASLEPHRRVMRLDSPSPALF